MLGGRLLLFGVLTSVRQTSVVSRKFHCIRAPLHPAARRCFSSPWRCAMSRRRALRCGHIGALGANGTSGTPHWVQDAPLYAPARPPRSHSFGFGAAGIWLLWKPRVPRAVHSTDQEAVMPFRSPRRLAAIASCATAILLTVAAGACASAGTGAGAGPRASASSRTEISQQEFAENASASVYEVVSRLRPSWLRTSTSSSATGAATVFLDGQPLGGPDVLRRMSAGSVSRATYYSATEAQSRFGMRVSTPVIALTTM